MFQASGSMFKALCSRFQALCSRLHNKGFTLIELLITLGITVVVATVGTISLFSYRAHQDLDLTVKEIVAVLRDTQQKSIGQVEESQWGVHFENSLTGPDFYAVFKGASYTSPEAYHSLKSSLEFLTPVAGESKDIVFAKVTGAPTIFSSIAVSLASDPSVIKYISVDNVVGKSLVSDTTPWASGSFEIHPDYKYAWSDNGGWLDMRGGPGAGVIVGETELTGFAYGTNYGLVSFNCSNDDCNNSDYKVNNSGGVLSGYAWSENFGWISFNCLNQGVDFCLNTSNYKVYIDAGGIFRGWAWNDNIGWISFNCEDSNICGTSNYYVKLYTN